MAWNHRAYATLADPARQSDLADLASAYGCPKRFAFRKEEASSGVEVAKKRAHGATVIGSGVHGTIATYLEPSRSACAKILSGSLPSEAAVRAVLERQVLEAAEGLPIEWKAAEDSEMAAGVQMVLAALRDTAARACEVVLVEAPFLVELPGASGKAGYVFSGTIDLVYRPRTDPTALVLADWKTGATRPSEISLDHGYQLGIYAAALASGTFFPGTPEERRIEQFPSEMFIAHLRDAVPYQKSGSKAPSHRDEIAYYQAERGVDLERGSKVAYKAGEQRGPVWYRGRRVELDIARLRVSVRNIVSTVRLGRFVENIGDDCARCAFKHVCLEEGYSVEGDDKKRLERITAALDFDGFDDAAA